VTPVIVDGRASEVSHWRSAINSPGGAIHIAYRSQNGDRFSTAHNAAGDNVTWG
jgi:hypothetical protein